MLEYKVTKITKQDAQKINKILLKEIRGQNLLKNILMHIRKDIALKVQLKGEIVGFCLAREYKTHFSLSYYFIIEQHRKKLISFFFFMHCLEKMKSKAIFVRKNRNYEMYKRYFKTTEDENILRFNGLRKDSKWAALLKKL